MKQITLSIKMIFIDNKIEPQKEAAIHGAISSRTANGKVKGWSKQGKNSACDDSTSAYMVICFNYITKVSSPTYLI